MTCLGSRHRLGHANPFWQHERADEAVCGHHGWPLAQGRAGGQPPESSRAPLPSTAEPVEAELTTARNLGSRLARVADRLKDLRVTAAP
jgi:hypothetical protein